MKPIRATLVAVILAGALAGCGDTPEEAFRALAAAARAGDREGVLEHLTGRSRVLASGFLAAAPEARPLLSPPALADDVTVQRAAVQGERAELTVRAADGPPVPVVLLREGGRWAVDLVECQRLWGRAGLGDDGLLFDLPEQPVP